jgi:hypothetical protein
VIVITFFVVLLCCVRQASAARRLLLLASVLVIAFVASGMLGYLDALASISARPRPQLSDLFKGWGDIIFNERMRNAVIGNASPCYGPNSHFLPCIYDLVGVLFLPPLFFTLYAVITSNIVFRALLLCYLLLQFGFWFFGTVHIVLFDSFREFDFYLLVFSGNTFVIFPYMIVSDRLQRLVALGRRVESSSEVNGTMFSLPAVRLARAALWVMFVIPATAAVLITFFVVIRNPSVAQHPSLLGAILHGIYKGNAETSIVRHLRREIALERGSTFRGVAATYLGNNLAMERMFGKQHRYDTVWTSPLFFSIYTQNPHQNAGLWEFGIPTYDEYGHMITKGLYNFTKEILTARKIRSTTGLSGPTNCGLTFCVCSVSASC